MLTHKVLQKHGGKLVYESNGEGAECIGGQGSYYRPGTPRFVTNLRKPSGKQNPQCSLSFLPLPGEK